MNEEIVIQRSQEEVREELERIRQTRNFKKEGKDGFITMWRKRYWYRRIPYEIAVLKYFSFNKEDPLSAGLNAIGMHAVLEYPKSLKELNQLLEKFFPNNTRLFHDTLHGYQHAWMLDMMVDTLHKEAREDIDWLLDEAMMIIQEGVKKLNGLIKRAEK